MEPEFFDTVDVDVFIDSGDVAMYQRVQNFPLKVNILSILFPRIFMKRTVACLFYWIECYVEGLG